MVKTKHALLVVDCQNDFVKDSSPYSCQMFDEKLKRNIARLVEFCRSKSVPIIYTHHSIRPDKSNAEHGEPRSVRACIVGTRGWQIVDKLKPEKADFVVRKDKYDAFYRTKLDKVLKRLGVKSLVISGVLTNNCVRDSRGRALQGLRRYCRIRLLRRHELRPVEKP